MDTPDLKKERLKLIVRNLKQLVDALESEVYSDVDTFGYLLANPEERKKNSKDLRGYDLGPGIADYDEVYDDDDGYPD